MSKERLGAFMDAVIAIVMTILVLELEKPAKPTLEAFWDLRINYAAYALSFLWLAAMWTSLHNAWHVVDKISNRTMWLSMGLLFFSSLFPYATSLVSTWFSSRVVQGFYGVIVIATTVMLILIYRSLAKDDPRERTVKYMKTVNGFLMIDVGIKIVGTAIGVLFWPPLVSIHSNALGEGGVVVNHYNELSDTVKLCCMLDTLKAATALAEREGVQLNLEALNIYTDHVGNFLSTTRMAAEICRIIASDKLRILYDVYHMQIDEGNLCGNIAAYGDVIGHVHIADVPGRHEPGTSEINYVKILKRLDDVGYTGIVGCELFPETNTAGAVRAIMRVKAAVEN